MTDDSAVPDDVWASIVRHAPVVSVDLVVRVDGGVLLGKRRNEPAKGEWFIPGGRVQKHQRLVDAVARVGREELGVKVDVVRRLGVYEHCYDVADVPGGDGKHYAPVGYLVEPVGEHFERDDQHAALRVFEPPFDIDDLHPHVVAYLRDAGLLDSDRDDQLTSG